MPAPAHRLIALTMIAAASVVAPAALLVLMPIALGVPHIVNDVRFLVLPLPRRQIALAAFASAVLIALRVAAVAGGPAKSLLVAEALVVATWLLLAVTSAGGVRALGVAALAAALIVGAPLGFVIAAGLAHNLVAIGAWAWLTRPGRRAILAVTAAALGLALAVGLLGPPLAAALGTDSFAGLSLAGTARLLLPGAGPTLGPAILVAFLFLQAVHYAIWLHWIPQVRGTRGRPFILAVVAAAAVLGAAAVDVVWARATYLALATFHVYLELVVLAARAAAWRRR